MEKFKIEFFMESQKACEILEDYLITNIKSFTKDEFLAINAVLFRMTMNGEYTSNKELIN